MTQAIITSTFFKGRIRNYQAISFAQPIITTYLLNYMTILHNHIIIIDNQKNK